MSSKPPLPELTGRSIPAVYVVALAAVLATGESAAQTADHCPSHQPADYSGQTINDFNFGACPRGSLVGAKFTGAKLQGSTFAGVDLTDADFSGAFLGPSPNFPPVSFANATLKNTIFRGASMPATNFEFAVIHCADFSNANLLRAEFGALQHIVRDPTCRTKFVGASLDVNLITDRTTIGARGNWSYSDFTNASFQGIDPATVNFRGQDIRGAILTNTNFVGVDFAGANLSDVKFDNATINNAVFDQAALNGATFRGSGLQGSSFICAQGFGASGGTKQPDGSSCPKAPSPATASKPVEFTNAAATNANFTGAQLSQATFSGATLTRSTFRYADFTQATFQSSGATIGPAQVGFGVFDYATFKNAQISSVDFSGGSLIGADFSAGTTFSGTNFSAATLDKANFAQANIQETNFSSASLKSASFVGAVISQVTGAGAATTFSCAQAGGADFSNADIKSGVFNNAVMVAARFCCEPETPGTPPYCGIIDSLGIAYAETKFPNVSGTAVRCPNGTLAHSSGSGKTPEQLCPDSWRLATNWTTTGCSPAGQQTMWAINCHAGPGDIVKFADDELKQCILQDLPGQTEVLVTTAEAIGTVNCPGRGIAAIGGLEYFKSMHTLDLSSNELTSFDLKFRDDQGQLVSLNLENNKITSLDLSSIPGIEFLNVANNRLTGITLSANTYLHSLKAQNNLLKTLDLSLHTTLFFADVSGNQLTDALGPSAKSLGRLTSLGFLDLSNNALSTIGSVTSIASDTAGAGGGSLQRLYLHCNPNFACGDLGIVDGTKYPAAGTSGCSRYVASSRTWVGEVHPECN